MSNSQDFIFNRVFFDDVDRFCAWEVEMGWDIGGTQLSCGPNSIWYEFLGFPDLTVVRFRVKQAMFNAFTLPSGYVLFFLPRMERPLVWNGGRIEPEIISAVLSDRSHDVVLPEELDAFEFIVSEELVRSTQILPLRFLADSARLKYPFVPLDRTRAMAFTRNLDRLFAAAVSAGPMIDSLLDKAAVREFLVQGLQEVFDAGLGTDTPSVPRNTRRADLVAKAREFVAAHLDQGLTSEEIAQAVGASRRVLRHAFQDTMGMSPYRYHLTERLHAVRRILVTDHVSVTDASLAHGFNTPSRFARQYKRLFGELPSHTRRHAP